MKIPTYKHVMNTLGKAGLVLGVVISLTIAIQFITTTAFVEVDYDDFCPSYEQLRMASDQDACTEVGGQWYERSDDGIGAPIVSYDTGATRPPKIEQFAVSGSCSETQDCRDAFATAQQENRTNRFVLAFGLSLLAFLLGIFALSGSAATALVWTGVISMLFSLRHIPHDNDRFIALAAGVVAVILVIVLVKKQHD